MVLIAESEGMVVAGENCFLLTGWCRVLDISHYSQEVFDGQEAGFLDTRSAMRDGLATASFREEEYC